MAFKAIGSAEAGAFDATGSSGGYEATAAGAAVVTSPALSGSRSFEIDPVNGVPVLLEYGFKAPLDHPAFLTVMFMLKTPAATWYDDGVSICELGNSASGGTFARRANISTSKTLSIVDKDEDLIGETAANYVKLNTVYYLLWYVDLRSPTRDILWVWKPADSVTDTSIAFVDGGGGADTITDTNDGFITAFTAGEEIVITGDSDNNGTYDIVAVASAAGTSTITLATGSLPSAPEAAGDSVTVTHTAQWYKAIDVAGHGDGDPAEIGAVIFGTRAGKTLPTAGDPFYLDDMCVETNPNEATAIGSAEVRFVAATANGSVDSDFDAGTGTSPDWNDVKEIPPDDVTSYDRGITVGDQQAYKVANKSDTVLVARATGQIRSADDGGAGAVDIKAFLAETADYVRDYASVDARPNSAWFSPSPRSLWETVNGKGINSVFDDLEVGIEIISNAPATNFDISQLGVEYMVVGPHPLPSDFPMGAVSGRRIFVNP